MSTIEVFSDFLCPFCFIAEASTLASLQEAYPDLDVSWRGFELHPEIPRGGIPIQDFFPEEGIRQFKKRLEDLSHEFGIEPVDIPTRLPNTMKAHAMTEYARMKGKQRPVREAIMNAYWRDGLDIESDEVLGEIAQTHGLNRELALAASKSSQYELKVIQNRAAGYERGVAGVPTYFVNGKAVMGCQAMCAIEEALRA